MTTYMVRLDDMYSIKEEVLGAPQRTGATAGRVAVVPGAATVDAAGARGAAFGAGVLEAGADADF
jgi:hypothetical protein